MSIYNRQYPVSAFTLKNNRTGVTSDFDSKSKVTALYLGDGRTDVTIEDFVPLFDGVNPMTFLIGGVDQNVNLLIDKDSDSCGLYFKFLNRYGRWNYWLFSKNHFRKPSSKYLSDVENDYANLEDTISPTLQIGKTSDETIKCIAERLDAYGKRVLEGILDSPKILMFTGERFAKASKMDWMEVRLKSNTLDTVEPGKDIYSYILEFDLPERNTQTL